MLDVITDFWKPVKKSAQGKPDLDRLQLGSVITFGTVPQTIISNRAFKVTGINTYQFGDDRMTSFVLANDKDEHAVSLIVASAEGEQYLAISRRIVFAERMRMFDPAELEAVVEQPDAVKLTCREIDVSWKHWVVSAYKKEISGASGSLFKGAARNQPTPANVVIQNFEYMLLTSETNEYAVEVERYTDGRLELYATVYRRVSDVVSVENPYGAEAKVSAPVLEVVKTEAQEEVPAAPVAKEELVAPEKPVVEAAKETAVSSEPVKEEVEKVDDSFLASLQAMAPTEKKPQEVKIEAPAPAKQPASVPAPAKAAEKPAPTPVPAPKAEPVVDAPKPQPVTVSPQPPTENKPMQTQSNNGAANDAENVLKPKFNASANRTVALENDSIECELRVANKIIEEAIRNEIRLSDVVRRIIALPVANPESVNIPITLSDSDFQLLAIRYGMSATDQNAIKARIIEEMNEFSGKK